MAKRLRISELESKIAQLKNSDNIMEYNSQVSTYTTLTSVYNNRLDSYTKIYSEYEKYAAVHDYIFEHKFDRKGVYNHTKNYPVFLNGVRHLIILSLVRIQNRN